MKQKIKGLIAYLQTVDNLYYKVVLGIIAFALLWIAVNLQDLYELIDYKFGNDIHVVPVNYREGAR